MELTNDKIIVSYFIWYSKSISLQRPGYMNITIWNRLTPIGLTWDYNEFIRRKTRISNGDG